MGKIREFDRCIYCFEKKENKNLSCPVCGYADGMVSLPVWWLTPGTILKGRYMIGMDLEESEEKLVYLGWDMRNECKVEITEYFPKKYVTRDITCSENVSCIPGKELQLEEGRQAYFEKAKTFFQCVVRVEEIKMDFFIRNNTCYDVREKSVRVSNL